MSGRSSVGRSNSAVGTKIQAVSRFLSMKMTRSSAVRNTSFLVWWCRTLIGSLQSSA